ncbi:MAG: hypothetical protein Q7S60_03090 [bacterium]|nr:hypothetical protein [bacterium]
MVDEGYGGKKNWPKLILIYLVVGGIIYALIYFLFLRGSGAGTNFGY